MNKLINKICEESFVFINCDECNKPAELYIQYDYENDYLCRECYRKQLREAMNHQDKSHIDDFIMMVKIMANIKPVNN